MKNNLSRALNYCARNIRCESEVKNKLMEWGIESEEGEKIFYTLKENKFFLEDSSYIDNFLENISSVKGYSKIQLKYKLLRKHLPSKLIDSKLNEFYKLNEEAEFNKFIIRNKKKIESKPREKAINYLLSKGFSYILISKYFK